MEDNSMLFKEYGGIDRATYISNLKSRDNMIDEFDIDFIIKKSKTGRLFFDSNMNMLDKADDKDINNVYLVVVPIGYNCLNTGFPICTAFINQTGKKLKYYMTDIVDRILVSVSTKTCMQSKINTINNLRNTFSDYIEIVGFGWTAIQNYNNNIIANIESEDISSYTQSTIKDNSADCIDEYTDETSNSYSNLVDLCNNIYSRLMDKEAWKITSRNKLEIYISNLLTKILQEQKKDTISNNGFILNSDKQKCLINTGLIDEFSNDVYIVDLTNSESSINNKKITIMDSKIQLIQLGFKKEEIVKLPKPVKYYKNKGELIFNGTIEEFDLDNTSKLRHIIMERISRFPEKYHKYSSDTLCRLMKNAIVQAVKISERDYKYFVPMYNFAYETIQFLVPIYLEKSTVGKPDVVAVVWYNKGYYCVQTILNVEIAYDNARLISRPDKPWICSFIDEK